MKSVHSYVLFADIVGYSKLEESDISEFSSQILTKISEVFKAYSSEELLALNTWGDAVMAVFSTVKIADAAIRLRDIFVNKSTSENKKLNDLKIRIACHFGDFFLINDPLLERFNVMGGSINLTARIEPVVLPNHIYVTRVFKNQFVLDTNPEKPGNIGFDLLGEIELAKSFGSTEVHILRRSDEQENIIHELRRMDLTESLPDVKLITQEDISKLKSYGQLSSDDFKGLLQNFSLEHNNPDFILGIAEQCKNKGLYTEALEFAEQLDNYTLPANGIDVPAYCMDKRLLKVKANCLTRLGEYDEASKIMYCLWKSGHKDSDTLSMLAAQYKRRALYAKNEDFLEQPNVPLLERAGELYTEAFRRNVSEYYPAINAAGLYHIIQNGIGHDIATYIIQMWKFNPQDWWQSVSIAEAHLIKRNANKAIEHYQKAISQCNPPQFELDSTRTQLKIYEHFLDDPEIKNIIDLMK